MTSAVIKNTLDPKRTLGVGNVVIRGGTSARVDNWHRVKNAHAVAVWLEQGIITVESEDGSSALPLPGLPLPGAGLPGLPDPGGEDEQKQAIIDELATYGIEKTKRSSLENLAKELDAAKASGKKPSAKKGRS
jgi:hypothetical protein